MLKCNVLYKVIEDRDVLVVPQEMQAEVIKSVHIQGHFAVAKTENLVKENYYFPNLRRSVENVLSNCIKCILVNKKRGKTEGFLHPIPKEDIPFRTYYVDFIGPLQSTNNKNQHIFTVVDGFTKLVWWHPVKSLSTQDALQKLKQQQAVFGSPASIIIDKGAAFTSKEFENYCSEGKIQNISITTGILRSNGQVESMHGILIHILAKLSIKDPTK